MPHHARVLSLPRLEYILNGIVRMIRQPKDILQRHMQLQLPVDYSYYLRKLGYSPIKTCVKI